MKDFLESILDIEIESLTLDLGTELMPDFYDGKKSRVDVRTRLSDGTEVNIELQMNMDKYSEKRCLQYWSKIYSNNLKEGKDYTKLKKTICIWILDGEKYKEFEDFQSKWEMINKKHMITGYFSEIEFHVIELKKFRKLDIMKPRKKEFWLWFIDHTNEELVKMAYISNERIKEAREQLDRIRADEELMEIIRLQELFEADEVTYRAEIARKATEEGLAKGRAEGRAEGKAEGEIEKQKEIAINLVKLNIPTEQIAEATGLSCDEIEKLKNEENEII